MSTAGAVVVVEEQEIKQEALSIAERVTAIKIVDQDSYDQASNLLLAVVKPFRSRWKDFWYGTVTNPGPVKLAHKTYQSLLDKFNEGDDPLESAEKKLKGAIQVWDDEQTRIVQERQREAQRKAEADEAARRLQESVMAEEVGAVEEAEAIMSAPSTAVAAPVEPTYQRATGISSRENYKCRVEDLKALCKAIGKGEVPVTYVEPNMSALNARAKADKLTMQIPGCKAYNDPIIAGGSR